MQDDVMIRPARFHSKEFHNAQMYSENKKRESLAIVDYVRHFREALQGQPVTILSDHQPRVAFMSFLQSNQMISR